MKDVPSDYTLNMNITIHDFPVPLNEDQSNQNTERCGSPHCVAISHYLGKSQVQEIGNYIKLDTQLINSTLYFNSK